MATNIYFPPITLRFEPFEETSFQLDKFFIKEAEMTKALAIEKIQNLRRAAIAGSIMTYPYCLATVAALRVCLLGPPEGWLGVLFTAGSTGMIAKYTLDGTFSKVSAHFDRLAKQCNTELKNLRNGNFERITFGEPTPPAREVPQGYASRFLSYFWKQE